jgi:tetratricopeptide (TPR) repeat protein
VTRRARGSAAPPAAAPPDPTIERLLRALLAAGFLLAALLAFRQVGSADIGFHLKTGEWILDGNGWPRTDPFTETMAGQAYIDTSWGFDVLVALLHRLAGPAGLVLFVVGAVLGLFALLVATTRLLGASPAAVALLLPVAVLAMEMRFEPRPELLSYLFLALQVWLLTRRASAGTAPAGATAGTAGPAPASALRTLAPSILVQLAWANSHSLFVLGWGAMAAFLAGGLLEARRLDRPLAAALGLSVAGSLLNPYGFDGLRFPFTLLTRFAADNPFAGSIAEFVSPLELGRLGYLAAFPKAPLLAMALLAALALLSIPTWLAKRRWTLLFLALLAAPLAAAMLRNVPLFVVLAWPGVAWALTAGTGRGGVLAGAALALAARPRARAAMLGAAVVVVAALAARVGTDAYYVDSRRTERIGADWNRRQLPVEAAAWAAGAHLPGKPLNHINFGGWLMHAQDAPVFIDTRLEVVGESFFNDYRRILGSEIALEHAVARHDIGWFITPHAGHADLIRRLSADPRWRLGYVDGLAALFVRIDRADVASPDQYVAPFLAEWIGPGAPDIPWNQLPGLGGPPRRTGLPAWLAGFVTRQDFPFEDFYVGLFHLYRGEAEPAARRFTSAVAASGGRWHDAYVNLGSALWRLDRKEAARAAYRVALEDDPGNRVARERLSEAPPN